MYDAIHQIAFRDFGAMKIDLITIQEYLTVKNLVGK